MPQKKTWRFRCEICGQPVGFWDESDHRRTAHPELMAVYRQIGQRYLVRYFPLAMLALVFAVVSVIIHDWWWRLGLLLGLYSMFAILIVFCVFAWKKEKPVQLDIEVACPVCDRKVTKKELRPHLSEVHAEIYRLMKRTFWLLGPTLYGFLIYLLVLIGLIILDVFGKSFLAYALLLLFGPLFAWVTILAVVGVYMGRRYLRPARMAWQVLRPPSP